MDSSSSDDSSTDSSSESITDLPEASAGIVMLSLPDSFEEGGADDDKSSADQDDVFETPPEYALATTSQDKTPLLDLDQIAAEEDDDRDYEAVIVAVGGCGEDGDGAVDLGMDSDLVIPEGMEFRVSKRDLSLDRSSAESSPPSKKSRSSDVDSEKSEEELETEQLSLSNSGSDSDHTLEIAGNDVKSVEESSREIEIADNDVKLVEGSSGEKKVEYSGSESENGTQPVTEESGSSSGEECSFQADGEVDSSVMRAEEGREWSSLLEMVKLVKEIAGVECNEVERCSFLDIAKRRGMTFPRL